MLKQLLSRVTSLYRHPKTDLIIERQNGDVELREQLKRLRALTIDLADDSANFQGSFHLSLVPQALVSKHTIVLINDAMCLLLDQTQEELIDRSVETLFHVDCCKDLRQGVMQEWAKYGSIENALVGLKHSDGRCVCTILNVSHPAAHMSSNGSIRTHWTFLAKCRRCPYSFKEEQCSQLEDL